MQLSPFLSLWIATGKREKNCSVFHQSLEVRTKEFHRKSMTFSPIFVHFYPLLLTEYTVSCDHSSSELKRSRKTTMVSELNYSITVTSLSEGWVFTESQIGWGWKAPLESPGPGRNTCCRTARATFKWLQYLMSHLFSICAFVVGLIYCYYILICERLHK